MGILSGVFNSIQKFLFPVLEDKIGELTGKQKEFKRVVEAIDLDKYVWEFRWNGVGRKKSRLSLIGKNRDFMKKIRNFGNLKKTKKMPI